MSNVKYRLRQSIFSPNCNVQSGAISENGEHGTFYFYNADRTHSFCFDSNEIESNPEWFEKVIEPPEKHIQLTVTGIINLILTVTPFSYYMQHHKLQNLYDAEAHLRDRINEWIDEHYKHEPNQPGPAQYTGEDMIDLIRFYKNTTMATEPVVVFEEWKNKRNKK